MKTLNITNTQIKIINKYLENKCIPNNIRLNSIINKIDNVFLKSQPINHQLFLYKFIDLNYDKNKHRSQFLTYKGFYNGFLLTNLYPDPILLHSKEPQKMMLKINIANGSKCILLNDTQVLLNRNSIISVVSVQKFIINVNYQNLL